MSWRDILKRTMLRPADPRVRVEIIPNKEINDNIVEEVELDSEALAESCCADAKNAIFRFYREHEDVPGKETKEQWEKARQVYEDMSCEKFKGWVIRAANSKMHPELAKMYQKILDDWKICEGDSF